MRGCRRLSNAGYEVDGLDDLLPGDEQVMFDVAFTRERRREQQGYMTPAQARAFLQMSRHARPDVSATPQVNPIARAYFHAIEWPADADAESGAPRLPAASGESLAEQSALAVNAVVEVLREAGILPEQPRALLDGPQGPAPRLARIQTLMQCRRRSRPHRLFDERPGAGLSGERDRGRLFDPGTSLHAAGGIGRGRRDLQPRAGELAERRDAARRLSRRSRSDQRVPGSAGPSSTRKSACTQRSG